MPSSSKKSKRGCRQNRPQWTCEHINRTFNPISDKEMRQRLAEFLELLLSFNSQLTKGNAFSSESISSQNSGACLIKNKEVSL
jgi:hypothetical protein